MRSYDKKEPILGHCCVLKSVIKQIFNLFSAKANLNHMNSISVKNWVAPCETKCQKASNVKQNLKLDSEIGSVIMG